MNKSTEPSLDYIEALPLSPEQKHSLLAKLPAQGNSASLASLHADIGGMVPGVAPSEDNAALDSVKTATEHGLADYRNLQGFAGGG